MRQKNKFPNALRLFILFIGLTFSCFLKIKAQELEKKYSFIKKENNRFYFSKDSSSFQGVCDKINFLKSGQQQQINVIHIGGSHVQGGTWSNSFITNLQNQFSTIGGGYFVFPYKIAKTNGQPYARSFSNGKWKRCRAIGKEFCQPLGLCAMNISTNDSANYFGVGLTNYASCKQVNLVKVFHNFNNSFQFNVKISGILTVARNDFPEMGYSSFEFPTPLDSVIFELKRVDTLKKDFVIYGMSMENTQLSGFYLAGLGANGASSSSFLRCNNLAQQLSGLHPDLAFLSLGVNDTQSKGFEKEDYIEHYDSLITILKRANPKICIILTTTTDNYIKRKSSNKRTITAKDAMFELMYKHNVAVWDLFSLMGGYKSMPKWNKAGLAARDRVHFTVKGYHLLGDMMFEAFMQSFNNHQKNLKESK